MGACAPGPWRFTERTAGPVTGVVDGDGKWDVEDKGGTDAAAPQAPWRAVVERAEWEVEDLILRTREEEEFLLDAVEEDAPAKGG